jgi:hypothetical protein
LINQLRAVLDLTHNEIQVVVTRVTQVRTDALPRFPHHHADDNSYDALMTTAMTP